MRRHPRRIEAAGVEAFRVPVLPFDARKLGRLGHRRSTITRATLCSSTASPRRAARHRLDGRLRRPVALKRRTPVYVAPKNSTLDHHVLKMKGATSAMFSFGQKHGVQYLFKAGGGARAGRRREDRGRGGARDYGAEKYIHAERPSSLTAGGFCNNKALLERYIPTAAMGCASSYLTAGETGECFRMGLGVNADVSRLQQLGQLRRRRRLGGRGRPVGALPLRRHDAAVAPAVVHRRPLRQPSSLHGQPRGRGRRERHLRAGRSGHHPDGAAGAPLLHRLRRALRGSSGRLRAGALPQADHADLEQIDKVRALSRLAPPAYRAPSALDVLKKRDSLEELERDLGFPPACW